MRIVLNGREQDVASSATIADLSLPPGLAGKTRRDRGQSRDRAAQRLFGARVLAAGDRVEVVHAIGGG